MVYGGLSAGMLIAGEVCPLDPEETGESEIRLADGLGLFRGVIFEPHFASWNRLPQLKEYLRLSGISEGYGVDDAACVVLRPGCEMEVLGAGVTRVGVCA
jgi:cyanophycinase